MGWDSSPQFGSKRGIAKGDGEMGRPQTGWSLSERCVSPFDKMVEDWQRKSFESLCSSSRGGRRDGSKRCMPMLPAPPENSSRELLVPPVMSISSVVGSKAACSTAVITGGIRNRRGSSQRAHSSKVVLECLDTKSDDNPSTAGEYECMQGATSAAGILKKVTHVWDNRQCRGLLMGMAGAAGLRLICPPLQSPILDLLLVSHQQLSVLTRNSPEKSEGGGRPGRWRLPANLAFVALKPFCGSLARRCLTTLFLVSHLTGRRNPFARKFRKPAAGILLDDEFANLHGLDNPSNALESNAPGTKRDAFLPFSHDLHTDECCSECGCVVEVSSAGEKGQTCNSLSSDKFSGSHGSVLKTIGDGEFKDACCADSDSEWEDVCLCSPKLSSSRGSGFFTDDSGQSCDSSGSSSTEEDGDNRRLFGIMDEGVNDTLISIAIPYPRVMGLRLQVPFVLTARSSAWCSAEQPMVEDSRYSISGEHAAEVSFSNRLSTAALLDQAGDEQIVVGGGGKFYKRRGDKSPNSVLEREDEASSVEDYRLDGSNDFGFPETRSAPNLLEKGPDSGILRSWDFRADHLERRNEEDEGEDSVFSDHAPPSPRRRRAKCEPELSEAFFSDTYAGDDGFRQDSAALPSGREQAHRGGHSSNTVKSSAVVVRDAEGTSAVPGAETQQRFLGEPLIRNGGAYAPASRSADDGASESLIPAAPGNRGIWDEVVPDDPFADHPTCINLRQRRHSYGDQTYLDMRELLKAPWSQLIFWHGRCNEGRPTLVVMLGRAVRQLPADQLKDFIAVTISHVEFAELHYIQTSTKQINILMDLQGLGLMRLPPMNILSSIGSILNRDYAGRGGWLILVNAPVMLSWVISAIQGVIFSPSYNRGVAVDSSFRGFLEGRERIMMLGSKYYSSLQSRFEANMLPVDLGGTCPCTKSSLGGGLCLKYGVEFLQIPLSLPKKS